jgi:hypothetical protein
MTHLDLTPPLQRPDFVIPDSLKPGQLVFVKESMVFWDEVQGSFGLSRGRYVVTQVGYEIDDEASKDRYTPGIALVPNDYYKLYLHHVEANVAFSIMGARNVERLCASIDHKGIYSGVQVSQDMLTHVGKLQLGTVYAWGNAGAALLGIAIGQSQEPAFRMQAFLVSNCEEVEVPCPTRINPRPVSHLWEATV